MNFIDNCNPLSCDNYVNFGNSFQEQLPNHTNLVIRTTLVFAKVIGRGQDALVHIGLGSIKFIVSVTMAIYSIPAAAFDSIPTHHKVAKEASRHFALALFFIADMPLSLAHICNMYPEPFCKKIQQKLRISPNELALDPLIDSLHTKADTFSEIQGNIYKKVFREKEQLKQKNEQLQKDLDDLYQKHMALLKTQLEHVNNQIEQEENQGFKAS
jgi:hypothetical protein